MGFRTRTTCGTNARADIWINTDPCGIVCAVLCWVFILFGEYAVVVRGRSLPSVDLDTEFIMIA